MSISLSELVLFILIAAVCGAIGQAIAGSIRGGLIISTVVGLIGAVIGPWIARQLALSEPLVVNISGHPFGVLWAIVGAAVFVALIHLVSNRTFA